MHQLRLAIEESTRAQTQTQAIAVYLSVQKDRIFQVSARLDALRKDIEAAAAETQKLADGIARSTRAIGDPTNPSEVRSELEARIADLKAQMTRAANHEQNLRNQEAQISQTLQAEEGRWTELIDRLEQVIKR